MEDEDEEGSPSKRFKADESIGSQSVDSCVGEHSARQGNFTSRLRAIIEHQFDVEIEAKKAELEEIDTKLKEAIQTMDRLRACIVAHYFRQDPNSIRHPAVQLSLSQLQTQSTGGDVGSQSRGCSPPPPCESHEGPTTRTIIVGNISKYMFPRSGEAHGPRKSHKWMVYVRAPDSDMDVIDTIEKVCFFLHPSFKPSDYEDVRSKPFRITRKGWGEFPVRLKIYFKSKCDVLDVVHLLKLDKTYSGLQTLGNETSYHVHFRRETAPPAPSPVKEEPQAEPVSQQPAPAPVEKQEKVQARVVSLCAPSTSSRPSISLLRPIIRHPSGGRPVLVIRHPSTAILVPQGPVVLQRARSLLTQQVVVQRVISPFAQGGKDWLKTAVIQGRLFSDGERLPPATNERLPSRVIRVEPNEEAFPEEGRPSSPPQDTPRSLLAQALLTTGYLSRFLVDVFLYTRGYACFEDLLQMLLPLFPLVSSSVSLLPWDVHSAEHFLRFPVGKRRAMEWMRAAALRTVSRTALRVLVAESASLSRAQSQPSVSPDAVWSVRKVVDYCRAHALTPIEDWMLDERNDEEATGSSVCSYSNHETVCDRIRGFLPSAVAIDCGHDVDIVGDVHDAESFDDVQELHALDTGTARTPLQQFVRQRMVEIGVREPASGVVDQVLVTALSQLISEVLRTCCAKSYANNRKLPPLVRVIDVYHVLCNNPKFDFLTNKYLGKSQ